MNPANDNKKRIGDVLREYLAKHPEIARKHYRANLKWLNEKLKGI